KDLRVDKPTISVNDELTVSVTVTNTGARAGKESVLVYVSDLAASISPPNRRLRRFAKVNLQPNQSRTLTFKLRREDLSFIGADNKSTVEPGDFEVRIGELTQRFTLR
ncbi:MAG TPA: fibronectin type III-like domain-contianing protein, partial [Pyrinomonadaceae bacterium]|nr:fibronectin type III-like domain-contianing protein [Pyrinomonadaceae bacterium]